MRLSLTNLPANYDRAVLAQLFLQLQTQINSLTEGKLTAITNALPAAPSTGDYAIGDIVRNSSPSELGTVGSKYVIFGWQCTATSPLTFKDLRCLTGN